MDEREIYNPDGSEDGLPLNIPSADAWSDMRRRLDDDMPVPGVLLPDNIIYVGDGFMRSIASLFILLCITTVALWVSGVNEKHGHNYIGGGTASSTTKKLNNALGAKSNKASKTMADNNSNVQSKEQSTPTNNNNLLGGNDAPKKHVNRSNAGIKSFTITHGNVIDSSKQDTLSNATNSPIKADSNLVEKPLAKTSKPVAIEKNDTTVHENEKKDEDDEVKLQAGLQWNEQVPFAGAGNYFIGPNGSSQPYRVLLPGAWLSLRADKYLFIVEVNPFASTLFNPKPFVTIINQVNNGQTTQTETRNLSKLIGASVAIRTDYNIAGNWWAGADIQANFWSKGVSNNYYALSGGGNTTQYKTTTGLNDSDWVYFFKIQVRGDAELMYKTPYWHAGIRTGLFLMPVAQNYGGPKTPLQTEMFFRLVLFNKRRQKGTK